MRLRVITLVLLVLATALPAAAVSKEIVQLQRDVALLQDAVRDLQRSVDEKHAVLRTLIDQSLDAVNRMTATVNILQKVVQDSASNSNARVDSLAGQVQSLSESVEELKARLGKMQQQLADTQSVVQSLDSKLSTGTAPGPSAGATTPPPANVPSAEVLYSTALRDFTAGKFDLARQEFADYLKYYPNTDYASNAQFYIGETFYSQKDFRRAVTEYDKLLERYPEGSNKLAAAQLKKGYALLELDDTEAGLRELRAVIKRFPKSNEARLARERLQRLGAGRTG